MLYTEASFRQFLKIADSGDKKLTTILVSISSDKLQVQNTSTSRIWWY